MTVTEWPRIETWGLLCGEIKGARKKLSQDYCTVFTVAGGRGVVLAVADGHGSSAHFRSDLGSRWAVEEFADCARPFAEEAVRRGDTPRQWSVLRAGARNLSQEVVHRWRQRVLLHERNAPSGGGLPGPGGRPPAEPEYAVYGSTLVGAVVTGRLLMCWQLGDGDLVVVGETGEPEAPFYTGPEYGDETESLCEPEAWRRMRLHWQPFTSGGPAPAVLLSTDGLSKSFADHQGFLSFASGVRDRVARQGLPAVRAQLTDWLERAAAHSGDDTTLVGAFAGTEIG